MREHGGIVSLSSRRVGRILNGECREEVAGGFNITPPRLVDSASNITHRNE